MLIYRVFFGGFFEEEREWYLGVNSDFQEFQSVAGFYLSSFVHLSYCASSVTRGEVWQLIDSTNWIVLTAITVTQRITRSRLVNLGQCSVKNSGIRVKRRHYSHLYWHATKSKFWEIWSNKHITQRTNTSTKLKLETEGASYNLYRNGEQPSLSYACPNFYFKGVIMKEL